LKPFLLRLLAFAVLFLVVVNPLLNLLFDRVLMRDTLLRRSFREFSAIDTLDVLVLGDSHSMVGVDARLMPMAYNYSSDGESYLQTWYKASRILGGGGPAVRMLVIPLDLHSFSSFRTERIDDPLFWSRYVDYTDLVRRLGLCEGLRMFAESWFFPYAGWLRSSGSPFEFVTGARHVQDLSSGFRPTHSQFGDLTPEKMYSDARKKAVRHFEGADPMDERLIGCFRDILDLCSGSGVAVAVVSYPVTDLYEECAEGFLERGRLVEAASVIAAAYPDVHLLDYSGLYGDDYLFFSDCDHLNEEGARDFTGRLSADLEAISGAGLR
jgi:hypothetical protein